MSKSHVLFFIVICTTCVFAEPNITTNMLSSGNASIIKPISNNKPFNYYYRGETLKSALNKYAQTNGLKINYTGISNVKLSRKVNGKISVASDSDLLNTLATQYGFEWFINSGMLYIASNEQISQAIYVAPENMPSIKSVLQQSGILNSKFGYSELPAENKIVVTGPISYVNAIMNQIRGFKVSPIASQFAVYRLKYANATDMRFTFNNQIIIIPGVATILQRILQGNYTNVPNNGSNELSADVSEPIKNQVGQLKKDNQTYQDGSGSITNNAIIQADNRLNTIVIRDKKSNLGIYRNLIALLDVPAPLIQVDVLIIHLDEDRLNENGINWWASTSQGYKAGFGASNLTANPGNNLSFYYGQVNPGQLLVSNINNFAMSLQMLEQKRIAKAVGKPSIATIDSLPAIVNVTENLYLNQPQNGGSTNSNNNGATNNNFNQLSITTALQITPHVIDDDGERNIKLSIVLQDGSVSDPSSNVMSSTVQSNISSQAVLKDGQSILLAGYSKNSSEKVTKKVPFLGDIPLLGWFFSSNSMRDKKIETLYLVTPKVIWEKNTYKLKDYVEVGSERFDIRQNYKILPKVSKSKSN